MKLKFDEKYSTASIYIIVVFTICLIIQTLIDKIPNIFSFFNEILTAMSPIICGIVIAYLLNPLANWVEKKLKPLVFKKSQNLLNVEVSKLSNDERYALKKKSKQLRSIAIAVSTLITILVIISIIAMVIPELVSSISGFTDKFPYYLSNLTAKVSNFLEKSEYMNDSIRSSLEETFTNIQKSIFEWFTKFDAFAGDVKDWVASVIGGVKNIGIGFVISIYILYGKEEFMAQIRKLMYALLPEDACRTILTFGVKCNSVFSDFIVGKAVDSLIIGILSFIVLTIMGMPYVVLISLVIGITNMIPFFGPFIGAIPSALLILLSQPDKTIPFIVFVIVLQQVDGNIIGPKILGDKLGLSTFWIMFAILVFGGLFDFPGMLIGVPVFTLLYSLVSSLIHNRLESKNLPLDKRYYSNMHITEDGCKFPSKMDYSDEDIDESVILKRSDRVLNKVKEKANISTSDLADRLKDRFSKKK